MNPTTTTATTGNPITINPIALPLGNTANAVRSLMLQLACAAALGLVVLYGVAFAESPLAHNAAHDVRHITVKPCH